MKWLLLALTLAQLSWSVKSISPYEAVISNHTSERITCYIYYADESFAKRRVKAYSDSRPFDKQGIVDMECF